MNEAGEWLKFWMVIRGKEGAATAMKHPSLEAAKHEAERLCAKEGGNVFYVLEATLRVKAERPPMKWEKL